MRIALAAILLLPFSAPAQEATASLTGALINLVGYVAKVPVELDSGTKTYRIQTDDAGVFQFSNLPAGDYTLTIRAPGYKWRVIKSIGLTAREQKRIPDIGMDIAGCGLPSRDLTLLPSEISFGSLSGSVAPPSAEVEVTLVCRTFSLCRSTKTDSNGRFSFEMLSPGVYGLNYHRAGFYPDDATGYEYSVIAGWKSVYSSVRLQRCPNANCDAKSRPPRQPIVCE